MCNVSVVWSSHFPGYVYNVTPYMEYHPGGIPELLRGIGQDATEMFDEVCLLLLTSGL